MKNYTEDEVFKIRNSAFLSGREHSTMSEETKTMFEKIEKKMNNDHEQIIIMQQDVNYIKDDIKDIKVKLENHCVKNEKQFEEIKVLLRGITTEAKDVASDLAKEKASEVIEEKGKVLFANKETQVTVESMQRWFFKTGITLIIMMGGIIAILIYSLVLNNKL